MTQQTLTRLRHLKLTGMADAVQQQLEQASLTTLGVKAEDIPTLAANALNDTCCLTNPRQGV